MKRLFTILLAVLSLLSLTACGGSPTEETSQEPLVDIQPQEPEAPPEPTPEELAAQEVEDLLASLTLEEKVGQLFFVRVPDTDAVSDVSTYHLGGYILFGRDGCSWRQRRQVSSQRESHSSAAGCSPWCT